MKHKKNSAIDTSWPELPLLSEWQETFETVHLWTQIVGKVRLESMPWINHSWHTTLYLSSRGLTTGLIPYQFGGFEIEFKFADHLLEIGTVNGQNISFDLNRLSVADFYHKTMESLQKIGVTAKIYSKPVEISDPIKPFPEDTTHASYEVEYVHRFWLALVNAHRVFTRFRSGFIGKVSPVHFFWGAFDLAVTRFTGGPAPEHPGGAPNCADWVMEEAYCRELSSAGFWPGTGLGEAAFYSYAYPEPDEYLTADIEPEAAYYNEELGEYVLSYNAVKNASNPDETLLNFLQSTYEAAAINGNWDRKKLEMNKRKTSN